MKPLPSAFCMNISQYYGFSFLAFVLTKLAMLMTIECLFCVIFIMPANCNYYRAFYLIYSFELHCHLFRSHSTLAKRYVCVNSHTLVIRTHRHVRKSNIKNDENVFRSRFTVRQVFRDEKRYYELLVDKSVTSLCLFPYHLADIITKGLRVTPFNYYIDVLSYLLKNDRSYDTLPNFTAADCMYCFFFFFSFSSNHRFIY